jgi:hypothetical protein
MKDVMTVKQFVEEGYLQEVNRLFFHPLGIALSISVSEAGRYRLGKIKTTDDPEGFIFGGFAEPEIERAYAITARGVSMAKTRKKNLGYVVEPLSSPRPLGSSGQRRASPESRSSDPRRPVVLDPEGPHGQGAGARAESRWSLGNPRTGCSSVTQPLPLNEEEIAQWLLDRWDENHPERGTECDCPGHALLREIANGAAVRPLDPPGGQE